MLAGMLKPYEEDIEACHRAGRASSYRPFSGSQTAGVLSAAPGLIAVLVLIGATGLIGVRCECRN